MTEVAAFVQTSHDDETVVSETEEVARQSK